MSDLIAAYANVDAARAALAQAELSAREAEAEINSNPHAALAHALDDLQRASDAERRSPFDTVAEIAALKQAITAISKIVATIPVGVSN